MEHFFFFFLKKQAEGTHRGGRSVVDGSVGVLGHYIVQQELTQHFWLPGI